MDPPRSEASAGPYHLPHTVFTGALAGARVFNIWLVSTGGKRIPVDEFSSLDYDPRTGVATVTVDARLEASVSVDGLIIARRGKPDEVLADFTLPFREGRWL